MSSKKHRPFRVGDRVRIINPEFVVRVGYPKCVKDYLPIVYSNAQKIENLLREMEGKKPRQSPSFVIFDMSNVIASKLDWALAYELAKRDGFGGTARTLHCQKYPEFEDAQAYIDSIGSVKTGIYTAGESWTDYDGEYSHNPPGLANIKIHRLAKVVLKGVTIFDPRRLFKISTENLLLVEESLLKDENE